MDHKRVKPAGALQLKWTGTVLKLLFWGLIYVLNFSCMENSSLQHKTHIYLMMNACASTNNTPNEGFTPIFLNSKTVFHEGKTNVKHLFVKSSYFRERGRIHVDAFGVIKKHICDEKRPVDEDVRQYTERSQRTRASACWNSLVSLHPRTIGDAQQGEDCTHILLHSPHTMLHTHIKHIKTETDWLMKLYCVWRTVDLHRR